MKRLVFVLLLFFYASLHAQEGKLITIETETSALVLKVGRNKKLYQTYFGTKLNNRLEYELISKENTKKFCRINDKT